VWRDQASLQHGVREEEVAVSNEVSHVRSRGWTYALALSLVSLKLLLLFTSIDVHGQTQQVITVRFLDFESGKPIKKLNVIVTLWDGESTREEVSGMKNIFETRARTDDHGSLLVKVPGPMPEHMSVFTPDLVQAVTQLSPSDVLRAGAVIPYRRGRNKSDVTAQAGGVVILNHKLTAADRMRQELP
jgi:hypothetical protein